MPRRRMPLRPRRPRRIPRRPDRLYRRKQNPLHPGAEVMRARLSAAVLLCLAIGPFAGASRAAETAQAPAKVAVDLTHGYARLLFTFERPTPVSASLADGVLTIKS